MASSDLPYLTIAVLPDGMSASEVVDVVAAASGIDPPTLRLRFAKPLPVIVGLLRDRSATEVVKALRERGFVVFTNTLADLAACGPTLKIRDLRVTERGIEVDLWRGSSTVIPREAVRVLVRASLRHEEKSARRPMPRPPVPPGLHTPGAVYALYASFDAAPESRLVRSSDKLDIHTADERVFQIDGDKFGYGILGDLKGHSDRTNMDSMCELLAHVTPNEIVDEYFPLWHPPPGYERLRIPSMRVNGDDPAFAFYSRWVALLYRLVAG